MCYFFFNIHLFLLMNKILCFLEIEILFCKKLKKNVLFVLDFLGFSFSHSVFFFSFSFLFSPRVLHLNHKHLAVHFIYFLFFSLSTPSKRRVSKNAFERGEFNEITCFPLFSRYRFFFFRFFAQSASTENV